VASAAARSSHGHADLRFLAKLCVKPSVSTVPDPLRRRPRAFRRMMHQIQLRSFTGSSRACAAGRAAGPRAGASAASWRVQRRSASVNVREKMLGLQVPPFVVSEHEGVIAGQLQRQRAAGLPVRAARPQSPGRCPPSAACRSWCLPRSPRPTPRPPGSCWPSGRR
jgi:hypothetical protein